METECPHSSETAPKNVASPSRPALSAPAYVAGVHAVLGWLTEKQASLPWRFFWIKGYSLTAITNHKNSLKGNIKQESITPQAVRDIVKEYGTLIGNPELAAHDLRRTFAKLAHKGGAGLDQIQLSLGHLSIKTTERYLGVSQNLTDAPCDHLELGLE